MSDDGQLPDTVVRARRAWSPHPGDAARVRASLERAISAGEPPRSDAPTPGRWSSARWSLAAAAVAAAGVAGYGAGHRAGVREGARMGAAVTEAQPAEPLPSPAPSPAIAPAPAGELLPAPSMATPTAAARREPHTGRRDAGAPAASAPPSLAIEVRALRNAERALRDGSPGLARAFLADLDRQVPNGRLSEERAATAAIARCAQHEVPFGVDLAADFTSHYPASVYRARVEQACAATDSPGDGHSSRRRATE